MIPVGTQNALAAYVGRYTGSGDIHRAKQYAKVGMIMGLILNFITFSFLFFGARHIAEFYSNIPELQLLVEAGLKLLSLSFIFDSFQGIMQGLLKALGRLRLSTVGLLVSLYFISIPLGYIFAFVVGVGLHGLWYGMICGLICLNIFYLYTIFKLINWQQVSEEF